MTWQTYKGQLTEKQEKTRDKIIKRTEKASPFLFVNSSQEMNLMMFSLFRLLVCSCLNFLSRSLDLEVSLSHLFHVSFSACYLSFTTLLFWM